jgi:hypothetical protein
LFSEKILEILYRIYDGLPPNVRAFISPVIPVFLFLRGVLFFASQFRLSVYFLQGREKWGDNNLTAVFLGDEKGVLLFSDLLYSEKPLRKSMGGVFIWRIKSKLNLDLPRADLIFIKIHGFFSRFLPRKGVVFIPEWTLFMMDLSRPLQEVWNLSKNKNKSLRENLRIVRRYNYSYKITRDPAEFAYFYSQMYLPYVTKRFEELSLPTGFRDMERVFKKGQLLLVKKENDYVSGVVIRMDRDTVFAVSLGVIEGKIEHLRTGALTALYYFTILFAKDKGYKWVDFGHCRSFLKDGVFNYKKHWGMEIRMYTGIRDVIGMKICNFHQGVETFLEKNPFIFIDQEKLKGLISVNQNHPLILEEVQSLVKTYSTPGLDCLVILSDQGFTQQAEEFANSCSTQRVHLISTKTDAFFEAFPHVLHLGKPNR